MTKKIAFTGKSPGKRKRVSFDSLENTMLLNVIDHMCDYDIASSDIIILIKSRIEKWRTPQDKKQL